MNQFIALKMKYFQKFLMIKKLKWFKDPIRKDNRFNVIIVNKISILLMTSNFVNFVQNQIVPTVYLNKDHFHVATFQSLGMNQIYINWKRGKSVFNVRKSSFIMLLMKKNRNKKKFISKKNCISFKYYKNKNRNTSKKLMNILKLEWIGIIIKL